MAVEFKLPELGENVLSGTLSRLLVKAGEVVEKDQPLLEIETDKAVVEVPANQPGKVLNILVKEGDVLKVGQTILMLEEKSAAITPAPVEKMEQKAVEPAPVEKVVPAPSAASEKMIRFFTLPELGENIYSGTISKILVAKGDRLSKGQSVIELETEKAVVELPIDFAGVVRDVLVKEGEVAKIGQNLLEVEITADMAVPEKAPGAPVSKMPPVQVEVTPSARDEMKIEPVAGLPTSLPAGGHRVQESPCLLLLLFGDLPGKLEWIFIRYLELALLAG